MPDPVHSSSRALLRNWFLRPPRAHGEVDRARSVGYLELFYDLVFVVFIAQIGSRFVQHVSWSGLVEFMVLFAMMWTAWLNGSLYHEAHGRDDGRHRAYIFAQMYLLILLAVFASDATGAHARGFAITYATLMVLLAFQWFTVYRTDTVPKFRRHAAQYTAAIAAVALLVYASALIESPWRLAVWAVAIVLAIGSLTAKLIQSEDEVSGPAISATGSLAERFALLTIIVLGEIVVGVVNGILEAEATPAAITVGLVGLTVGFGFWWNYFDALDDRVPCDRARYVAPWMLLHIPLHGSVAAAGVGMVALIDHAEAATVEPSTRWLLAGSTALLLVLVASLTHTVDYPDDTLDVLRPFRASMWLGAAACLGIAFVPGPAWLVAALLVVVLLATWTFAFVIRARCALHKG